MIKFDAQKYMMVGNNTMLLKSKVDDILGQIGSFKNIFLIGSGGSYAMFLPFEQMLSTLSSIPAYAVIAAELMAEGHNQLSKDSICIFTSTSGTTKETVAAADYCRNQGATTICISGRGDVPFAQEADYVIVNQMDDFSASDADYLLIYLLVFGLMKVKGDFDEYEDFCKSLNKLPTALVSVKEACDKKCADFAQHHKDTTYHLLTGAGTVWGETYSYGMCVMEEMQWIRTKTVKASEFFHGTLEIVEEDTSVIVVMGEDKSRAMCERVVNFAQKITSELAVFDSADYQLPGVDDRYRPLLSPIIITAVLDRLSIHFESARNHSLDIRRYYRQMEY